MSVDKFPELHHTHTRTHRDIHGVRSTLDGDVEGHRQRHNRGGPPCCLVKDGGVNHGAPLVPHDQVNRVDARQDQGLDGVHTASNRKPAVDPVAAFIGRTVGGEGGVANEL